MMYFLDDFILLKEINSLECVPYTSNQLHRKHPDKIIVYRHTAYIRKDVLEKEHLEFLTDLTNYIPLAELADQLKVERKMFYERIWFMEKTKSVFFEYMKIGNTYFIKIDEELKELFQKFQPFIAKLEDSRDILYCRLLGDIKIGFY